MKISRATQHVGFIIHNSSLILSLAHHQRHFHDNRGGEINQ